MIERVYLSPEDKDFFALIKRSGLGRPKAEHWIPARLALARSLQESEAPDPKKYKRTAKHENGIEIHSDQMTGEGKGDRDDYTDLYRGLLSVYHNANLFDDQDDERFSDLLQQHVRRGLDLIRGEWNPNADFNQYILQQLFSGGAPGSELAEVDGPQLAERVARILGQLGVGGKVLSSLDGPRLTRLIVELQELDDLDRLRKGLGKIAFALGEKDDSIAMQLAGAERQIYLDVPRGMATWRAVSWQELKPSLQETTALSMALPICLGTDVLGAPYLIDLAEAPHLFVGGTTGSGKSMCLHAILLSLLASAEPAELVLIDPKAVEFSAYAASKQLRGAIHTAPEDAIAALRELVTEMDRRQELMRSLDARNIQEARRAGAALPRIVAVIDELGDLMMTSRDIEVPLIRLAQKARSSGIHLVLATQRPEAATFPGLLRSNIPSRIALTVQKASESRIILDEAGAEALLMRGDMLVRFAGRPIIRAHGARIEQADIISGVRRS